MSNPVLTSDGAASTVWTTFKTCKHTRQDHLTLDGSGKGSNSTFRKASAAWILFVSPAPVLLRKSEVNSFSFFTLSLKNMEFFFEMACKSTAKRSLFSRPSKSRQHQKSHAFCPKDGAINFLRNDTGRVCRLFSPIFGVPHTPDGFASHVFGRFGLPGTLPFHPRPGVFVCFFPIFKSYSWKIVVNYRGFL